MPPRRSCFTLPAERGVPVGRRFNATTAFLLPIIARLLSRDSPRFNATTAFLLREAAWAEAELFRVSMPPRRSCFRMPPFPLFSQNAFQCHHGVPASRGRRGLLPCCRSFNATTAFLLPLLSLITRPGARSFNATTAFLLPNISTSIGEIRWRFNATTAFLLRVRDFSRLSPVVGFNATTAFLLPSGVSSIRAGA